MKEGLKSDAAKKMRIDVMHRNQEVRSLIRISHLLHIGLKACVILQQPAYVKRVDR